MQHEIAMYAIAQKEGLGFDKAVETCKARMARYQVRSARNASPSTRRRSRRPLPRPQR